MHRDNVKKGLNSEIPKLNLGTLLLSESNSNKAKVSELSLIVTLTKSSRLQDLYKAMTDANMYAVHCTVP